MRILLAGGTGFIGKALGQKLLQNGHEAVLLTRSGKMPELDTMDAVINLAGESIAKRWSDSYKKKIVQSRIDTTRALVEAIRSAKKKPSVLVNASAVGYYGDVPEGEVDESFRRGQGFLAQTCERWENEAKIAESFGVRVVYLRFGIVIEKGGGALGKMIPPFQFFAGGPLGSGRQYFPWVHRDDIVNMLLFALEQKSLSGAINAVSPNPVTMKEFCSALGHAMHRPSWAPVPAFLLKLILGEMSGMLLEGQKAVPAKLKLAGYRFLYPDLRLALEAIFSSSRN